MRIWRQLKSIASQRDYGSAMLLAVIFLIASWLVCLPFFDAVQRSALNRYHLQTNVFLVWSIQQLVPSIYNFENEFEFNSDDESPSPNLVKFASRKKINHFPMRVVTFYDGRFAFFHEGKGGDLTVRSRFQDQELETHWRIDCTNGSQLRLIQRDQE